MSGAPSYSSQPYPFRNIHGYLRQVFEAFGPERSFWGTDITRMPCSYRQCVTMFTEELPWLKGRDLERVMGGAIVDRLGWKRPGAALLHAPRGDEHGRARRWAPRPFRAGDRTGPRRGPPRWARPPARRPGARP